MGLDEGILLGPGRTKSGARNFDQVGDESVALGRTSRRRASGAIARGRQNESASAWLRLHAKLKAFGTYLFAFRLGSTSGNARRCTTTSVYPYSHAR